MKKRLPRGAGAVFAEWPIREGGLLVAGCTDADGLAYIAVKTLNRLGKTSGLYDWERARRLKTDRVVGFIDGKPLVVRLFAFVTKKGLAVIVRLPPELARFYRFEERYFVPWGSGEPAVSLTILPGIDHLPINPFPTNR